MPMVKKANWKKDLNHDMSLNSLDDDKQDVLAIDGKGTGKTSPPPKGRKIQIKVKGTMDSGASNFVAPIEAVPG
eukprot:5788248-Heterocapsa_arctica.AAC.1